MITRCLVLVIFVLNCTVSYAQTMMGHDILKKYQSKFYALPITHQEHFAARMYIITGNTDYLTPITYYLYCLSERYRYLYKNINNDAFIEKENQRLLSTTESDTLKTKKRIEKSLKFPKMAYYLNLLILTNKIYYYHLQDTLLFPETSLVINFLKTKDNEFQNFIFDKENIKLYGAQLVNYVYYLYDLGIMDLRNQYTETFRRIYPNNKDTLLSDFEYSAKIYGMTHFITSASRYYQQPLNSTSYAWITAYFKTHIDEIITRTEYDVIVEVGVCLMLTHHGDTKAIKKIKSYLKSAYDKNHHMLPDKMNSFDFTKGEHRNILAIMFFNWPKKLNKIPKTLLQNLYEKNFIFNEDHLKLMYGFRVPY